MNLTLPRNIDPNDHSPEAYTQRMDHFITMGTIRPHGDGFRKPRTSKKRAKAQCFFNTDTRKHSHSPELRGEKYGRLAGMFDAE